MSDVVGVILTTGLEFTVTVTDAVPVHDPVVPVTVYVVVEDGLTFCEALVPKLLLQL
jgi:hypothetical protein